ncbi:DUF5937 family protein [Fodinicola feengrottensis]|nr:DUF5937 family protein [Fodinicola feengrottensis]
MLELVFTVPDLSQLRFAYSPLWELVASFRVLNTPARHALHAPWITHARRLIADSELAGSPDLELMRTLVPANGYIPDFLTPPPTTPLPNLQDELAAVLETPSAVIRADLRPVGVAPLQCRSRAGMGERVGAFYDHPQRTLRHLVGTLRTYWDLVLAEHWPRIRTLLDADLSYRTGRLARGGPTLLFADLHSQIEWAGNVLRIEKKYQNSIELAGRGLVLVPSAMAWPSAMIMPPPWQPTLIYPPRGVATLWETGKWRRTACPPAARRDPREPGGGAGRADLDRRPGPSARGHSGGRFPAPRSVAWRRPGHHRPARPGRHSHAYAHRRRFGSQCLLVVEPCIGYP